MGVAGTCCNTVWLGVADVRTCGELLLVSTSAVIAGRIRELKLIYIYIHTYIHTYIHI